jgi:type II secretory pathway pseudopilin PulG
MWTQKRLLVVLTVSALICLAAILGSFALKRQREGTEQLVFRGRLAQIAVAIHMYYEEHGRYPPLHMLDEDGRPMHSWRVFLLKYLDAREYYDRYDFTKPWNSPSNSALARQVPQRVRDLFRCPSDTGSNDWTSVLAIDPTSQNVLGKEAPIISSRAITATKIVLLEVRESQVHWLEPKDLPLDALGASLNKLGRTYGALNFVTTDGKVGTLLPSSIVFRGSAAELLQEWIENTSELQ